MKIKFVFSLAFCLVLMMIASPALAFLFGGPDFTKLSPEEAAKAIKEMDSQIQSVAVQDIQGAGLTAVIVFRAEPSPNELLQEGKDLMDVAREITEAKGSEKFGGVVFQVMVPMVDKFNNKSDAHGIDLYWRMATLKQIKWDGFQDWQFLGVVDDIRRGPLGNEVLQRYCGGRQSYSSDFCGKPIR